MILAKEIPVEWDERTEIALRGFATILTQSLGAIVLPMLPVVNLIKAPSIN
jgi:hypothetical protein